MRELPAKVPHDPHTLSQALAHTRQPSRLLLFLSFQHHHLQRLWWHDLLLGWLTQHLLILPLLLLRSRAFLRAPARSPCLPRLLRRLLGGRGQPLPQLRPRLAVLQDLQEAGPEDLVRVGGGQPGRPGQDDPEALLHLSPRGPLLEPPLHQKLQHAAHLLLRACVQTLVVLPRGHNAHPHGRPGLIDQINVGGSSSEQETDLVNPAGKLLPRLRHGSV
mmetsp:Transcript_38573/g.107471  ORF Transcript_38573/g.107471 Transcript_38573/m.107471 type:complete len:218 (+) Transcript_38573:772-1425(+)